MQLALFVAQVKPETFGFSLESHRLVEVVCAVYSVSLVSQKLNLVATR